MKRTNIKRGEDSNTPKHFIEELRNIYNISAFYKPIFIGVNPDEKTKTPQKSLLDKWIMCYRWMKRWLFEKELEIEECKP
jgi:hypothetical protein